MTDLEAARATFAAAFSHHQHNPGDDLARDVMIRAERCLAVQERMAEDVAEHEARQARFMRK